MGDGNSSLNKLTNRTPVKTLFSGQQSICESGVSVSQDGTWGVYIERKMRP
jgi:hypothetical protein